MSDDDIDDIAEETPPRPRQFSAQMYAVASEVRDVLLPEFTGQHEDTDDFVELTPDGQAVCDGAFTPKELCRVMEAAMEAQRRCAPSIGVVAAPPLESAPQPVDALHRLRFTIGPTIGTDVDRLLGQAEAGIANMIRTGVELTAILEERNQQASNLNSKLQQVVAVLEAEKRARVVGGSVVDPALIDNLAAAIAAPQ
jgi:hypothetical protein